MMNEVVMILGMSLVTFAVRYPVMVLVGKIPLPQPVFRALRYVPPAVLAAIIVPELLLRDGQPYIAPQNSFLVAGIFAALVAWRTKNLLLTIVLGMAALWLWRALIGV
jgi:branched-subunit amino acid transport protein